MGTRTMYTVAPSAARLTSSLRDIGYDLTTAVADVVDNSIAAEASRVDIVIADGRDEPWIMIADDGTGMSANRVNEALRFGSRSTYRARDLGRYGLGLKTASLSQCRSVTVASRRPGSPRTTVRQLDLDLIAEWDDWMVVDPGRTEAARAATALLDEQMSTVVVWERLDRLLPGRRDTGNARRRLATAQRRLHRHMSMVFHRYLAGETARQVVITVNGEKLEPWDPFATDEPHTKELPAQRFELACGDVTGRVILRRWVLPARQRFSSPERFEELAGPLKWNRQQGLYFYRADRLVQCGGWAGLRAIDEHTKLARASVEFDTDVDEAFAINVAKVRVSLPAELRQMLERPIGELCQRAETAYRRASLHDPSRLDSRPAPAGSPGSAANADVGLALLSAAAITGHREALREIAAALTSQQPDLAAASGIDRLT